MQEKDIKNKINQELDEMAPDVLGKILSQPIEPVKSEKELFGRNKPLFKAKRKIGGYAWTPAILATAAACILIAVIIAQPWTLNKKNSFNTAFDIIIDVNPSISIKVNSEGNVERVVAGNKDAKKIVEKINKKIGKKSTYNQAVKATIKQLNKSGYLKSDKNAMLLSVVSDNSEAMNDTVKEIKMLSKTYKENKQIKCSTVYQNVVVDEEIKKVADKNKVSVGKAAFCIKIAKKEKTDADSLCDKNIYTLIEEAKVYEANIFEQDIVVEGELELISETEIATDELQTGETETENLESESESLGGYIEETTVENYSQIIDDTSINSPNNEIITTQQQIVN